MLPPSLPRLSYEEVGSSDTKEPLPATQFIGQLPDKHLHLGVDGAAKKRFHKPFRRDQAGVNQPLQVVRQRCPNRSIFV